MEVFSRSSAGMLLTELSVGEISGLGGTEVD